MVGKWYVLAALLGLYFYVEYVIPKEALCTTSMGEVNILGAIVSNVG